MSNSIVEGYRLSPQQRRLWSLQDSDPASIYTAQCVVLIEGALDRELLTAAVAAVVRRREVLRTTIRISPAMDIPVQSISPEIVASETRHSLRDAQPATQEKELAQLIECARSSANTNGDPPLRLSIVELADDRHVLILTLPAYCNDAAGMNQLVHQIGEHYRHAEVRGGEEESLQYADLSEWQNDLLESPDTGAGRQRWQQLDLRDLLQVQLPWEMPQSKAGQQGFSPKIAPVKLDADLTARVVEIARSFGVSEAGFWLACWASLLSRLTGTGELVIGTAFDGRHQPGLEDALGPLTKYLPLPVRFDNNLQFDQLLATVDQQLSEAREWQDYFSWDLVESHANNGAEVRYCSVGFDFSSAGETENVLPSLRFSLLSQYACLERFTVKLSCHLRDGAFHLQLHYDESRYSVTAAEGLGRHLVTLVQSAVQSPRARLSELAILTDEEGEALLAAGGRGETVARGRSLLEGFREQVVQQPQAIALSYEGEHLSYGELERRASLLGSYLRRQGVKPEEVVAVLCERSLDLVVGMLGVLKAGGAYLPIDVRQPGERVRQMLEDSGVRVLLTQAVVAEQLPLYPEVVLCLDTDWARVERESGGKESSEAAIDGEQLCYVIYTSGSTGKPKGVMVTHGNVSRLLAATETDFGLSAADVWTQFHSPGFDFSVWEIWGGLLSGGRVVLVPYLVSRAPEEFWQLLEQEAVTVLNQTPSAFRQLQAAEVETAKERLRLVIFGGEALELESLRGWWERHEEQPALVNMYGITETTVHVTQRRLGRSDLGRGSVIGRGLRGWQVYVTDGAEQLAAAGVVGEMRIGGAGVARGYLGEAGLTAARFVPDGVSGAIGGRLYRSGDLGRWRELGDLEYLGRGDRQVKLRGFRIEPGEIEAALLSYPGVRAAVVVARENGTGGARLLGYVVGADGAEPLSLAGLREHLAQRLPDYMVPAGLMVLERLPLTANGKLDRDALPEPERVREEGEWEAPRTPVEEVVAGVWSEVLGVERVGLRENFFELGGHSLLATQVVSRLREALGVELGLRVLFETPTVEAVAAAAQQALAAGQLPAPALTRVAREGGLPLSFAQQRLWFLQQLEPQSVAYNIPLGLRLQGRLQVAALERSLSEIVRRHEVLRTTFATLDGQPVQQIDEARPITLKITSLDHLPSEKREAEARRLAKKEAERSFNLVQDHPFRVHLLRLDQEDHVLVYTKHHIVSDAWSMGVMVRELIELYKAFVRGESSPLPELPVQYADFAFWQRQWLSGDVLNTQLAYWRDQLAGIPALLELPCDRPRSNARSNRGAVIEGSLPPDLSKRVRDLGRLEGATLYMVLLSAFQVLLHKYSGQDDIVVGTPIAGRIRPEVENLIGFFVNTLVLRARMLPEQTFLELLRQVRETALNAFANQDVPFEKVVEQVQPERSLSHTPVFQVVFSMQNAPSPPLLLPGITAATLPMENETSKFDLVLNMWDSGSEITTSLRYNTDLFDHATVSCLLKHLETLLRNIVANPSRTISDLSLLTRAERKRLTRDSNQTEAAFPLTCAHHLFEEQAARTPDAEALIFAEQHLSYGELNRRANQIAHHLRSLGVKTGAAVGLYFEHSIELIASILAVLKTGAAYVPLDPAHPKRRTNFAISDAHVSAVLAGANLVHDFPGEVTRVTLDANLETVAYESAENLPHEGTPQDLAYIIYTSGSTGVPKGVMIEHAALVNYICWARDVYRLDERRDFAFYSSLSFDLTVTSIFAPLLSGGRVFIYKNEPGDSLTHILDDQQVKLIKLTPSHLALLEGRDNRNSQIKCLIVGGEAFETRLARHVNDSFGGVEIVNEYGPTEATVGCMIHRFDVARDEREAVPVGVPAANVQIHILDREMRPTAENVPGELYIGGAGLARGYLGRPEQTASRFVPDPFAETGGVRLYRTGDRGRRLASGVIEFLGRTDEQVKFHGHRVELGELRAALNRHARVRDSVVMLREDGAGRPLLVAYYVARQELEAGELRQFMLGEVVGEVVPQVFVHLKRLPLTLNGKVNYEALPEPVLTRTGEGYAGPRTPVEELVAGVWSEVLGVERIGIRDNFFELGGHSLLATLVISRLRELCGVELSLRTLFEAPTVAGIAERIHRRETVEIDAAHDRIERANRDEALPLSFAQQRLWFLQQLEPESYLYNVPVALRLTGRLDVTCLEQSLDEVVRRHETLRTSFPAEGGQPRQRIAAHEKLRLEVIDLSQLGTTERDAEVQRQAFEEWRHPFNLVTGPLYRVRLLRVQDDVFGLLFTVHHIISDGWSMEVLLKEMSTLYRAFLQNESSPLPELAVQYADYSLWQRDWLEGGALDQQLSFWKAELAGAPTVLDLPNDRPRPPVQTANGAHVHLTIPAPLTQRLKDLGRRQGTTLFMTLLAAFQILLGRYTGQQDIVVGTPIAGRGRAELEPLIGFFVNTLLLRTDLSGDPSFADLLKRVRQVCLDAYTHQDVPFEKLVEELQPERDMSRPPLFQVVFMFAAGGREIVTLEGVELETLNVGREAAKFDLTLELQEIGDHVAGAVVYNSDLFESATIEQIRGHYLNLLEQAAADPSASLSRLELLDQQERELLIGPSGPCFTSVSIHERFLQQAHATPDAPAMTLAGEHMTYFELERRSSALSLWLRRSGVGPETLVALLCEPSFDLVIGMLAVLKAGGAYLPIDPLHPPERVRTVLEDSGARVLLTQAAHAERLLTYPDTLLCLDTQWSTVEALAGSDQTAGVAADPERMAYVIYTSGSTGKPKGVMVSHRNLSRLLDSTHEWFKFGPTDVWTLFHSAAFDFSVWEIWGPLLTGGRLVIVPYFVSRDSESFRRLLVDEQVTVLNQTPSAFRLLMKVEETLDEANVDPLSLRLVIFGGEALEIQSLKPWFSRHGDEHPQLVNMYGITETTVHVTYRPLSAADIRPRTGSLIGGPIPDLQVYILDQDQRLLPFGVPGEIYVGGAGVARGYLDRPALTATRFVPDPFSTEPGWRLYRTGDLGRKLRSSGEIEYLGRVDRQVKIRGFRIELGEVEAGVAAQPGVSEVIVIGSGDPGETQLVAYVVPQSGDSLTSTGLRKALREQLPDYMVPSVFVFLDSLPLTPNGKVDLRALPPPGSKSAVESEFTGPRNPIEEVVAGVWSEVLQVEQLDVRDNFFELGGHSLLATQVVSRLREALRVEIALRTLFESPTVAALSREAERALASGRAPAPPIPRVERDGQLPLSFAQQRLWFLHQVQPKSPVYNVFGTIRFGEALNRPALERSFAEVVRRHEVLRTTFPVVDGRPLQHVNSPKEFRLEVIDLGHLPPSERENEAQRLAREEARRPFNLEDGPLFRLQLLRLGENDHLLLYSMHHIVSDGWSMGVLIKEVTTFYHAFSNDTTPQVPELPVQYADYAVWQRQLLAGEALEQQLSYWRQQLTGAAPSIDLATDKPRPPVQSFRGARVGLELSPELTSLVREFSRRENATLYMVLLAAFQALLHKYSGQEDLVVGTPVAGRTHTEIEHLIGFFVNTLVLRTDLSGGPTFSELVERVRRVCLEAYAHQDVPFERLVEDLQPARDPARSPLFQVMFVLQNTPETALDPVDLELESVSVEAETAKFDLTLAIDDEGEKLAGHIVYCTDLFEQTTIERFANHYISLLESMIREPALPLRQLPLPPEEQANLLALSLGPRPEFPRDQSIHSLFMEQARNSPTATALVSGDRWLSYEELDRQSSGLAQLLRRHGVTEKSRVGLHLGRSIEAVVAILAVLKAGGAYLPLDINAPPARLIQILDDAAANLVLARSEQFVLNEWQGEVLFVDQLELSSFAAVAPESSVGGDHLAYVMYTSGSTGRQKGVCVTHRNVVRLVRGADYVEFGPSHTSLLLAPLGFDASTFELWGALLNGGRLVIVESQRSSLEELSEVLERENITTLWLSAGLFHVVCEEKPESLRGLRQLLAGGDVLDTAYVQRAAQVMGEGGVVINGYGPTETTTFACCHRVAGKASAELGWRVPIGRPIAQATSYVLQAEGELAARGMTGELYIGGEGVARGYLNRPDLTAERFVPDPFAEQSGARLYRTGDLVRWNSAGVLEFIGRVDQQLKLRGFRVEPEEIEAVLRAHAAVKEAAVIATTDATARGKQIAAFVTRSADGNELDEQELRVWLRERLPDYMQPATLLFLDSLPLTPNGKIDRRALETFKDEHQSHRSGDPVAARTNMERVLAELWAELLNVGQVGIYDNFFDLGGHSLVMVQMHNRLRNILNREVSIVDLFKHPTISTLAAHLEANGEQPVSKPAAQRASDEAPTVESRKDSRRRQREQRRSAKQGAASS